MMNLIYEIRHELSKELSDTPRHLSVYPTAFSPLGGQHAHTRKKKELSDKFTSPSGKYNPTAFSPMGALSAHKRKKKKKELSLRVLGN